MLFNGSNLTASANYLEWNGKIWSIVNHFIPFTETEVGAPDRDDVGWYQVRKALQARNASGDFPPVSFKPFETAYKTLTEKLQPLVYELGFLKS